MTKRPTTNNLRASAAVQNETDDFIHGRVLEARRYSAFAGSVTHDGWGKTCVTGVVAVDGEGCSR